MAGDWIKLEHTTPDKPEVFQMAETLGIDPDAVVGKLVRIWLWADQHTIDGHAPSVTHALLDRHAGVTGFSKALESVGWLASEDGGLVFTNFDRHNGQTAKKRAQARVRQERHRNTSRQESRSERDIPVTDALPEKRREEKRREDIGAFSVNGAPTPEGVGGLLNGEKPFSMDEAVKAIYKKYPRKVGKQAAIVAIEKAVKRAAKEYSVSHRKAAAVIFRRTCQFAQTPKGQHPTECPHPSTFFNQGRYDDDQATWQVLNDPDHNASNKLSPEALEALYAE